MKYCWNCSAVMEDQAQVCPECGKPQYNQYGQPFPPAAPRDSEPIKRWIIIIAGIIAGIIIYWKTAEAQNRKPKKTQSAAVTMETPRQITVPNQIFEYDRFIFEP